MGSKQGSKNGVPDFGGLPKMVAPRQFCFDTRWPGAQIGPEGPSGGHVSAFSKMGSENGVQNGIQKWGSKNGVQKWGPQMESKNGVQNGMPDFGGLPKMVAPRQFCFDTLDGRGPGSARGPSGGHFSAFSKMGSKMVSIMGSKNGAQK